MEPRSDSTADPGRPPADANPAEPWRGLGGLPWGLIPRSEVASLPAPPRRPRGDVPKKEPPKQTPDSGFASLNCSKPSRATGSEAAGPGFLQKHLRNRHLIVVLRHKTAPNLLGRPGRKLVCDTRARRVAQFARGTAGPGPPDPLFTTLPRGGCLSSREAVLVLRRPPH